MIRLLVTVRILALYVKIVFFLFFNIVHAALDEKLIKKNTTRVTNKIADPWFAGTTTYSTETTVANDTANGMLTWVHSDPRYRSAFRADWIVRAPKNVRSVCFTDRSGFNGFRTGRENHFVYQSGWTVSRGCAEKFVDQKFDTARACSRRLGEGSPRGGNVFIASCAYRAIADEKYRSSGKRCLLARIRNLYGTRLLSPAERGNVSAERWSFCSAAPTRQRRGCENFLPLEFHEFHQRRTYTFQLFGNRSNHPLPTVAKAWDRFVFRITVRVGHLRVILFHTTA